MLILNRIIYFILLQRQISHRYVFNFENKGNTDGSYLHAAYYFF